MFFSSSLFSFVQLGTLVSCLANLGDILFQLPFRDIFWGFLVQDEQKLKHISAHTPKKLSGFYLIL